MLQREMLSGEYHLMGSYHRSSIYTLHFSCLLFVSSLLGVVMSFLGIKSLLDGYWRSNCSNLFLFQVFNCSESGRTFCNFSCHFSWIISDWTFVWKIFGLQWALMTLLDPALAMENLIYIGYSGDLSSSIRVTRRRRLDRKKQQSERNVYQCFVFGPKKSGKSALLDSFIGRSASGLWFWFGAPTPIFF